MNSNDQIKQDIARAYHKLLNSIDWKDEILVAGLQEGLRKFISNAFLKANKMHKYHQGNFYSEQAKVKVEAGDLTDLIYEHMVPKNNFHSSCVESAKAGVLRLEDVLDGLRKYYSIAIITVDENSKFEGRLAQNMPEDWDGIDIEARYKAVKIPLISRDQVRFPQRVRGRKSVI